jgi:hypothetical protein
LSFIFLLFQPISVLESKLIFQDFQSKKLFLLQDVELI